MAVQEHGGANSQGAETLKHKISPGNNSKRCIFWVSESIDGCVKLPIYETSRRGKNCAIGTKGEGFIAYTGQVTTII